MVRPLPRKLLLYTLIFVMIPLLESFSDIGIEAQSSKTNHADFNGDGFDDVAIGVQNEDVDLKGVGTVTDAGAVNVIYGSKIGLSATLGRPDQFWTQNTTGVEDEPEEGDNFGNSIASGDFNGDGFDDVAIGVPYEDLGTQGLGSVTDAGAVNVIYGSAHGLSATSPLPDQLWTQDSPNVEESSQAVELFGWTLTSGDFNGDGFDDLAIGVFLEDVVRPGVGTVSSAGAVNVLYGSNNGLSATAPLPDQLWTQESTNVNDEAEYNDNFGNSLSSGDFNQDGKDDLAIGIHGEDANLVHGAVSVLHGSANGLSATSPLPDQLWTQDSPNVNDIAEFADGFGSALSAGDYDGDNNDDLAIGIPGEDIDIQGGGTVNDAGAVSVLYGSAMFGLSATATRPDQFWTQESSNVNDQAETEDYFGFSLTSGDFNGDAKDDLATGIEFEDLVTAGGSLADAGAVSVLYGSAIGLSATSPLPDQLWTQNTLNVDDVAETNDEFGFALSSADFDFNNRDDLAIGVPFEGVGSYDYAGAVNVLHGSNNGLSATLPRPDQLWTQNSTDVEDVVEQGDRFGYSLP